MDTERLGDTINERFATLRRARNIFEQNKPRTNCYFQTREGATECGVEQRGIALIETKPKGSKP